MTDRPLNPLPTSSERAEAFDRNSPYLQNVYASYSLEDGLVVPTLRQVRRSYFPISTPSVLREFSRLELGNVDQLLRFVHRWGLLGFGGLQEHGRDFRAANGGDPPIWIWAHASGLRVVLALLRQVHANPPSDVVLRDYLEGLTLPEGSSLTIASVNAELRRRRGYARRGFHSDFGEVTAAAARLITQLEKGSHSNLPAHGPQFLYGSRDGLSATEWGAFDYPTMILAWHVIREVLNDNKGGLFDVLERPPIREAKDEYTLEELMAPGARILLGWDSLLSVIYRHARELAIGGRISSCAYCRSPFVQTDKRQRFCPPDEGSRESRCAWNFRKQRGKQRGRDQAGA